MGMRRKLLCFSKVFNNDVSKKRPAACATGSLHKKYEKETFCFSYGDSLREWRLRSYKIGGGFKHLDDSKILKPPHYYFMRLLH